MSKYKEIAETIAFQAAGIMAGQLGQDHPSMELAPTTETVEAIKQMVAEQVKALEGESDGD